MVRGATAFWLSMIRTGISSASTIRSRVAAMTTNARVPHPTRPSHRVGYVPRPFDVCPSREDHGVHTDAGQRGRCRAFLEPEGHRRILGLSTSGEPSLRGNHDSEINC